ncbi:MAG TPA: hypothetical protein VFI09_08145 [Solirubrobacterales bacterium]|nr:hypothetical protein [Solirubrobacterales bacterium]
MSTTTIDRAAAARAVRDRGGSVSDARRVLEMLATDDEQRLRERREQRETDGLARDLGFLDGTGLLEAASSNRTANAGLFPGEALTAEPRSPQAAMREAEDLRLIEQADGDDELAEALLTEATERREREDLGERLGMTELEVERMLEEAPRLAAHLTASDDLRLAESIGVGAGELNNIIERVHG